MVDYQSLGLTQSMRADDSPLKKPEPQHLTNVEKDSTIEQTPFAYPTTIVKGNLEIRDGGTITIKDNTGVVRFSFVPTTGAITLNGPVVSNGTTTIGSNLTVNSSGTSTFNGPANFGTTVAFNTGGTISMGSIGVAGLVKRMVYTLAGGGATSGGANSFYTDSSTYQKIHQSRFTLNVSDFPGASFFLQAVYRAGASGDSDRTFYMNLNDITGGSDVANTEITGTVKSTVGNVLDIITGTANFGTNLPAGNRNYVLQIKSNQNGTFVDLYEGRMIIQY